MKQILSFLNVSNPEKLNTDSGVIFHRLLLGQAVHHGWEVTIASPINIDVDHARHIHFDPGNNKYEVRFRFDWKNITEILKAEQPDVILVNQIELVENFNALIVVADIKCKIATYCHYWPVVEFGNDIEWDPSLNHNSLAEGLLLKIIRAFQLSDIFMVTSEYAKELLKLSLERYNFSAPKKEALIVNCPADPFFLSNQPEYNWNSKKILYNSRLYEQYGSQFLLDLIAELPSDEFDFVVTDFFDNRNPIRVRLDQSVTYYRSELLKCSNVTLVTNGDIRSNYRDNIVSGSFLCFAPYRRNANWSMGAVDCMGLGIPAVAKKMASFPEFVPKSLLFDDLQSAIRLIKLLKKDEILYKNQCYNVHTIAKDFASFKVAKRFYSILNEK